MNKKIVLIRHGQSTYNKEKIFCGWTDVDLTEQGIAEAHTAGQSLKKAGYTFDLAFTSILKRAIETLKIALAEMGESDTPTEFSWRLNERHYGALQGLKHEDMAKKFSEEQVRQWRRSYKTRPPILELTDPRYLPTEKLYNDPDKSNIPRGESLEDTVKRVLPYWNDEIVPKIKEGKHVIISASGNSLRALIKYMDHMSDDDIMNLEIKTGVPLVYELDETILEPVSHYYLS